MIWVPVGVTGAWPLFFRGMGKKSGGTGNAYRNPVDSYRKQLGRNEEKSITMRPRGGRGRSSAGGQRESSKQGPMTWKMVLVCLVVLLVVGSVCGLLLVEASRYLYSLLPFSADPWPELKRTKRD